MTPQQKENVETALIIVAILLVYLLTSWAVYAMEF